MARIIYRMAEVVDLAHKYEVFVGATNDLLVRRNLPLISFTSIVTPRSMGFHKHALPHHPERF